MNFINGVNLIEEIKTLTLTALIVSIIVEIIGFIIGVIAFRIFRTYTMYEDNRLKSFANFILFAIGMFICFAGAIFALNTESFIAIKNKFDLIKFTGQYKVSVTENTDMNEFYEKYKVISYKDGIYVIKLK